MRPALRNPESFDSSSSAFFPPDFGCCASLDVVGDVVVDDPAPPDEVRGLAGDAKDEETWRGAS